MRHLIAASVLLILTVNADPASACSCALSGPPCQNYFQVDAVFIGTVRTITEVEAPPDPMPFRRRLVTFTVERALRGLEGTSAGVTTGMGGGDCGYAFRAGERYLVYAYKAQDGQLHTGICSRTRPIAEAADDLRFIDGARTAPAGARVSGTIAHWERDLAGDAPRKYGPAADVHVQLRGPGGAREARTDEQGRYEITGIAPGKYELQVFPPAVFSSKYLHSDINLADARACAVADFNIHFDGRVSGVLRAKSGQPATGVTIQLMASQRSDPRRPADLITATTDSGGYYELSDVPPGDYLVGVTLQRTMVRDHAEEYPRTFYPGTVDATGARVITIGEGTRVELDPLQLPAPRERREITGVVVWPDGRPVPNASIALWDGEVSWRQVAVGTDADAEGRFNFTVHEGLSYIARAHYNLPDDPTHRQAQGATGPFVVSTATAPLRVVVTIPPPRR
jgi:5-hydroxyisourate hydrolase-like protein (transthyretin family)